MDEKTAYGRYSMILEWEPQGACYVVTVPELPGCRTHGDTLEEGVKNGQEVVELWIAVVREDGDSIPPPRYYDLDGPNPSSWERRPTE